MTSYPDDPDGNVLTRMAADGIDMSRSMEIEFMVDAPGDEAGRSIEQAMAKDGYETELVYDEGETNEDGVIDASDEEFGPSWTIYAVREMVPTYDEIMRVQVDLQTLVEPFGGKADGWGCSG